VEEGCGAVLADSTARSCPWLRRAQLGTHSQRLHSHTYANLTVCDWYLISEALNGFPALLGLLGAS
jgi:hypothetical protein